MEAASVPQNVAFGPKPSGDWLPTFHVETKSGVLRLGSPEEVRLGNTATSLPTSPSPCGFTQDCLRACSFKEMRRDG